MSTVNCQHASHPAGQIQSRQVQTFSRHATRVVCLWSETGKKPSDRYIQSHFSFHVPSLTVMLFVSADLPTLLRGQVHYIQPRDTVRTSLCGVYHLLVFFLGLHRPVHWRQPQSQLLLRGKITKTIRKTDDASSEGTSQKTQHDFLVVTVCLCSDEMWCT